jgi:hypothetical protein
MATKFKKFAVAEFLDEKKKVCVPWTLSVHHG